MQNHKRIIHYDFNEKRRPSCGAKGQIYITSNAFYVSCKTCLRFLNSVKEMVLKDEKSYGVIDELIKIIKID